MRTPNQIQKVSTTPDKIAHTPGPLYDQPLRVSAKDYVILKRQIAKLRADFADYMYSISEPIPAARICPQCNVSTVYYDGCLGYESFQCPICHWDVNDPEPEGKK